MRRIYNAIRYPVLGGEWPRNHMAESVNQNHRKVVVTGMGAVTPLGNSAEDNWEALTSGKSGIDRITLFDASEFPVQIAGEVKGFDFEHCYRDDPLLQKATRSTLFAVEAAQEAFGQAGINGEGVAPNRCGIYFGAGDSGTDFDPFVASIYASPGSNTIIDEGEYLKASSTQMNGLIELETQPFMTASHLARRHNLRGPVSTCLTACAASSHAIGEAFEWIRRGDADMVLTGGSHSMVYPLGIACFSLLRALSTRNDAPDKASRPFDKNRDGFVLSEGAGVLVLEEGTHAVRRGAPILAEIAGYGSTADAYRLTDMDAEGTGARRAMEAALRKAQMTPEQIDYINAHGTSTRVNDVIETVAIKKVFNEGAPNVPISSIKSMLGHMIAAAGVMELIASIYTIQTGIIPPTINYEESDPNCDLDYVPNNPRHTKVNSVLSNSFGFGGQNICLVIKKYEEK